MFFLFAGADDSRYVYNKFPTLNRQINSCIDPAIDKTKAGELIKYYYNLNDAEFEKGFKLILCEDYYKNKTSERNFALELLIRLLSDSMTIEKDTIAIALSLSHNYYYSIADEETRKAMYEDIKELFKFYKAVTEWQKTWTVNYRLESVPVAAKACWAYRGYYHNYYKSLNIGEYKKNFALMENMKYLRETAERNSFINADSLKRINQNVEWFVHDNDRGFKNLIEDSKYGNTAGKNVKIENGKYYYYIEGQKYDEDDLSDLNFQMKCFKEFGTFIGDCTTTGMMKIYFYKAIGIPSFFVHLRPNMTHFFATHYNMFQNKWDFFQKWAPEADDAKAYQFQYYRIFWHHLKQDAGNNLTIDSDAAKVNKLVHSGIDEPLYEKMFALEKYDNDQLFNYEKIPNRAADNDNDGIMDPYEKFTKTDPQKADTDADGFADLWELEHGFDPLLNTDPGRKDLLAIDGITANETDSFSPETAVQQKPDNYKPDDFSIDSIRAKLLPAGLYVSINFNNKKRIEPRTRQCIRILAKGKTGDNFEFKTGGVYDDYARMDHIPRGSKNGEEINNLKIISALTENAEFLIPQEFFSGYNSLYIYYYAGRREFYSKTVRLALTKDDISYKLESLLKDALSVKDPEKDNAGVKEFYDIRNFYSVIKDGHLICYADFYNDISKNNFLIHTVYARVEKETYLIQWNSKTNVKNHFWKTEKGYDSNQLLYDVIEYKNGLAFIVDLKAIGNEKAYSISYSAGGLDASGKWLIHGDDIDFGSVKN